MDEAEIKKAHQYFAVELNNSAWGLIDQAESLDPVMMERLVNQAHASLYHWSEIGETVTLARGHHLVSRAYAAVGQGAQALRHAGRCLEICEAEGYGDWDLAFALEAVARAHGMLGFNDERDAFLARAKEAGQAIAGEEDRKIFLDELKKVPGYKG